MHNLWNLNFTNISLTKTSLMSVKWNSQWIIPFDLSRSYQDTYFYTGCTYSVHVILFCFQSHFSHLFQGSNFKCQWALISRLEHKGTLGHYILKYYSKLRSTKAKSKGTEAIWLSWNSNPVLFTMKMSEIMTSCNDLPLSDGI